MTQRAAEVARSLWVRDTVNVSVPEEAAAAAERICAQLRTDLARWIGSAGYDALLRRARELARPDHPPLTSIACNGSDGEEIAAAVRAHGAAEVTAAIVALVATLIDLLGRIVGEETAVQLVQQAGTTNQRKVSGLAEEGRQNG